MNTLASITTSAIDPALDLLPARMDSPEARVMLLAIGLQESRFTHRRQVGGPARGFWQFEKGGGVRGVLRHPASAQHANMLCSVRGVTNTADRVYDALEHDDILAAGFARLLLWTDPQALPMRGDDGWALYLRTWRPGKPHPHTWADFWLAAQEFVRGGDL